MEDEDSYESLRGRVDRSLGNSQYEPQRENWVFGELNTGVKRRRIISSLAGVSLCNPE